jgi:putative phage-type endonuclease
MPLLVEAQRTDQWHSARQGRITASLAAACLGLDPYTSRQKAWRSIVGAQVKDDNRHIRWGVQFEAAARLDYEAATGNIIETTGFWVHPTLDWLGASPDGLIGTDGLAEIKCPTNCPPRVPVHHRVQCLIQLFVTERVWCDYYSWGASGQRFLARIHRAGLPGLVARLHRFYQDFVVPGVEPPRKRKKG